MSALMCFAAASSVARVRPEIAIFAPSFANSTAAASPMPEPPPVIQATLPLSSPAGVLLGTEQHLRLFFAEARRLAPPLGEHLQRLLDRRALGDAIAPALYVRMLVDGHALALGRGQPRHGSHVGDGVLVAREPPALRELPVGADIDRRDVVLQAGLLEHDVDLVPVGRGPGIGVDHSFTSCWPKFFPARRSIRPRGALSRPCRTDSRYLSLPSAK